MRKRHFRPLIQYHVRWYDAQILYYEGYTMMKIRQVAVVLGVVVVIALGLLAFTSSARPKRRAARWKRCHWYCLQPRLLPNQRLRRQQRLHR